MKAVVVSNGEVKDYEFIAHIIKDYDFIVCADGGAKHVLKCNLKPDVLVGDLDSIDSKLLEELENSNTKIVKYPREKDYTDTQLAVNYAIESGADEIALIACTGDRLDHTLSNILLLAKLTKNNILSYVINEKNTIYIINKSINLKGKTGDIVSLIPVGGDVKGIYTEGLQYPLKDATITLGDPLGISNVFISDNVTVHIGCGFLLVIKSRD